MRDRLSRRYNEKLKVLKRIKYESSLCSYLFIGKRRVHSPIWMDWIGTYNFHMFKTYTSKDSKYKEKWGKKNGVRTSKGQFTRSGEKELFRKFLESQYNIKHFNISYGFIQDDTGQISELGGEE